MAKKTSDTDRILHEIEVVRQDGVHLAGEVERVRLLAEKSMRLDIYFHVLGDEARLGRIEASLQTIITKENEIMSAIDDKVNEVLASVTALHGKVESGIALIHELHDLIGNVGDPVNLEKLEQARALASTDEAALTAAITENDPTP